MCKKQWATRDDFLDDATLIFNGYQADLGILEEGLFFFTHNTEPCGTTMAIIAQDFVSLYVGERYSENKQGTEECPQYCLDKSNLNRCQVYCRNAFVREVSQMILERGPKRE